MNPCAVLLLCLLQTIGGGDLRDDNEHKSLCIRHDEREIGCRSSRPNVDPDPLAPLVDVLEEHQEASQPLFLE